MDSRAKRSQSSSRKAPAMRLEGEDEFQEEDVWSVLREAKTSGHETKIPKSHFSSPSSSTSFTSSPWNIRRSKEVSGEKQSSAPMNVPDWSKIYGNARNKERSIHNLHSHDEDDDDGCMVPPHEWVARKLAKTQISSFSMCEGVGRTLKGRDLSKMRNAVLTKTGFLEFNEAKCHKNTLVFQNSLTLSKSTLKVHCKSKDNDLGYHFVKFNDPAYNFSFHDDVFFFTTEFNCYLFWKGANLVYHQTFIAYVGAFFFRCGALYVWNARDDAIYLSIDRKPEKIMYNWIKE